MTPYDQAATTLALSAAAIWLPSLAQRAHRWWVGANAELGGLLDEEAS